VSDGQTYAESSSGERRYSDPGEARQTINASSGAFAGDDLLRGLRTLWRSSQVWYQPDPGGEWIAVTVERGARYGAYGRAAPGADYFFHACSTRSGTGKLTYLPLKPWLISC
jgi:hypothetical protein